MSLPPQLPNLPFYLLLPVLSALSIVLPITNYENSQHLVTISLGTPSQALSLLLDSGSNSLWVPSAFCSSPGCKAHSTFNHKLSSTYRAENVEFEVEYRSGLIVGEFADESMLLGNVTVQGVMFGLVVKEVGSAFAALPFAGIMGLGFGSQDYPSLVDHLVDLGLLKRNIVGIYLSQSPKKPGELRFGDINSALTSSEFVYAPLASRQFWDISLDAVRISGIPTNLCSDLMHLRGKCIAAIDTGTPILAGPSSFVAQVLALLPIRPDCVGASELPDIEIEVGGLVLVLEPQDYVVYEEGECRMALMPMDIVPPRGPLLVLGSVFLRKYYTVLDRDNSRVGFAEAVSTH